MKTKPNSKKKHVLRIPKIRVKYPMSRDIADSMEIFDRTIEEIKDWPVDKQLEFISNPKVCMDRPSFAR